MKKILLLAIMFVFFSCKQQPVKNNNKSSVKELTVKEKEQYAVLINEASKLYKSEKYLQSAQKYNKALRIGGYKGHKTDAYNAACSWALSKEVDSAFVQLFHLVEGEDYTDYSHMAKDDDLNSLHFDPRWNQLLDLVEINKEKAEANFDKYLIALLDTIRDNDQEPRKRLKKVREKYGNDSPEIKALYKNTRIKDSINLIKVRKIIDERGWLGKDIIGKRGNATLFMVIQHADLVVQEKYLPMARKAIQQGNIEPRHLALLEDRVAIRKGERQIYGSQIGRDKDTGTKYFYPIKDPDNVDKRRAAVGLELIKDYASMFDINWNLEAYKQKLPELERKLKIAK